MDSSPSPCPLTTVHWDGWTRPHLGYKVHKSQTGHGGNGSSSRMAIVNVPKISPHEHLVALPQVCCVCPLCLKPYGASSGLVPSQYRGPAAPRALARAAIRVSQPSSFTLVIVLPTATEGGSTPSQVGVPPGQPLTLRNQHRAGLICGVSALGDCHCQVLFKLRIAATRSMVPGSLTCAVGSPCHARDDSIDSQISCW